MFPLPAPPNNNPPQAEEQEPDTEVDVTASYQLGGQQGSLPQHAGELAIDFVSNKYHWQDLPTRAGDVSVWGGFKLSLKFDFGKDQTFTAGASADIVKFEPKGAHVEISAGPIAEAQDSMVTGEAEEHVGGQVEFEWKAEHNRFFKLFHPDLSVTALGIHQEPTAPHRRLAVRRSARPGAQVRRRRSGKGYLQTLPPLTLQRPSFWHAAAMLPSQARVHWRTAAV